MKKHLIMKSIYMSWFISTLVLVLFGACQKEEPSFDEGLKIEVRAPFGGADACGQLGVDLSGVTEEQPFIIARQEELGSFKACSGSDHEEIDFEHEFMVGVRICSACGILRKQEVTLQYEKLVYAIKIENSICTAITCSNYFLLIPKTYADYPIEMKVTKIN